MRLSFQPEDRIGELVEFLRTDGASSVVVLSGAEGIGRAYLLEAALHRLRAAGQSWQLVELDLEGYEPDHGAVEAFVGHALRRRPGTSEERAQLAEAAGPLLPVVGGTLCGAAVMATLLGLDRSAADILELAAKLAQHPLPDLPQRERAALLLERALELLSGDGRVVVFVRRPHRVPDPLKRLLLQICDRRASVVLAWAASPDEQTHAVAPGASRPPKRIELRPLTSGEVAAAVARKFSSSHLPAELSDALWSISRGHPRDVATRVEEMVRLGCLRPDHQGVWQLTDEGLEAAPLVRIFSYPFYDAIDRLLRGLHSSRQRQMIEAFLAAAVICGDNVPADLICAALGFDEDGRDTVLDFVDEHLVCAEDAEAPENDDERAPVFRDLEYNHPGLPQTSVYAFTRPIFRHAIRDRLPFAGWQALAQALLRAFRQILAPVTRAAAEVHLSAAAFLQDAAAREEHLRTLAWWAGIDENEALTRALTEQLVRRELDAAVLGSMIQKTKDRWPPYRTWALLRAYGAQPGGVPAEQVGQYHVLRARTLRQVGRFRQAAPPALRAARFFRGRNDRVRFGNALVLASNCLAPLGKLRVGVRLARASLELLEADLPADHPDVGSAATNLGLILQSSGDHAGAKAAHERGLRIAEKSYGPYHPEVAVAASNLGSALESLGDETAAKNAHERALHVLERVLGPHHPEVAAAANNLGNVLGRLGDQKGAKAAISRALEIWTSTLGPGHPLTKTAERNLASL